MISRDRMKPSSFDPYRPPDSDTAVARSGLTCPYCEDDYPLSWKQYCTAIRYYCCQGCGGKSRLKHTFGYYVATATIVLLGISVMLAGFWLGQDPGFVFACVLFLACGIFFDRKHDRAFGYLVPLEGATRRSDDENR